MSLVTRQATDFAATIKTDDFVALCGLVRRLFHLYLRLFVPGVGYRLSGNRGAYQYLAESARRFYGPGEVKGLLLSAGFKGVSYRPLLFGAAGIHVAVK